MPDPSAALAVWLRMVPARLHEHLLAATLNHFLRGQALATRLDELRGKRFRLCVDDITIALTFEIVNGGLRRSTLPPDVTLRGALEDFVALARRREDPDTLFFQRRLVVEGETETGLHLKNLLDGWEYDAPGHVRAVLPTPVANRVLAFTRRARAFREASPAAPAG